MYIWKATKLRAPAYPQSTRYVDAQGTKYPGIPMELLEEIICPVQRESDETHYNQEIDEYPYLRVEPKSQEQLDMQHNVKVKQQIAALEAGQARAVREATLTGDKTRLTELDWAVASLRATLKPEPPREG
jgi:hypothetical protein